MEKLINVLELASELAEKRVNEDLDEKEIYIEEENGDTRYSEAAQDLFNSYYDEYYEILNTIN